MNYIEQSLGTNERVVAKAHFHWWYSFKAWAALILLFWCVIGIVIFFQMMIRKWTTEIAVTDRRVIFKRGLIRRHTVEMNMQKVESVDVDQTLLGRLFDYGNVSIRGTGSSFETLHMIDSPLKLRTTVTTG